MKLKAWRRWRVLPFAAIVALCSVLSAASAIADSQGGGSRERAGQVPSVRHGQRWLLERDVENGKKVECGVNMVEWLRKLNIMSIDGGIMWTGKKRRRKCQFLIKMGKINQWKKGGCNCVATAFKYFWNGSKLGWVLRCLDVVFCSRCINKGTADRLHNNIGRRYRICTS